MSSDTKPSKPKAPPPEPEHLPCPRCDSINTKFCYYNNYNFSQPRHFCKGCRRYWTHGGTLRDIPIGGGTRKSSKRPRTNIPVASSEFRNFQVPDHGMCGSFTSMLISNTNTNGLLGLGGFGLGIGNGLEDVGFGLGRAVWPFTGVGENGVTSGGVHTWHVENGEGFGVGSSGECFGNWPDLAISTPGSVLK